MPRRGGQGPASTSGHCPNSCEHAPASNTDAAPVSNAATALPLSAQTCEFRAGDYVTDGFSLFRVEHTLADERGGELYVELENCGTMELIVCSVQALAAGPLRCVEPVRRERLTRHLDLITRLE